MLSRGGAQVIESRQNAEGQTRVCFMYQGQQAWTSIVSGAGAVILERGKLSTPSPRSTAAICTTSASSGRALPSGSAFPSGGGCLKTSLITCAVHDAGAVREPRGRTGTSNGSAASIAATGATAHGAGATGLAAAEGEEAEPELVAAGLGIRIIAQVRRYFTCQMTSCTHMGRGGIHRNGWPVDLTESVAPCAQLIDNGFLLVFTWWEITLSASVGTSCVLDSAAQGLQFLQGCCARRLWQYPSRRCWLRHSLCRLRRARLVVWSGL